MSPPETGVPSGDVARVGDIERPCLKAVAGACGREGLHTGVGGLAGVFDLEAYHA
jgi:hypothetical protein